MKAYIVGKRAAIVLTVDGGSQVIIMNSAWPGRYHYISEMSYNEDYLNKHHIKMADHKIMTREQIVNKFSGNETLVDKIIKKIKPGR